MQVFGSQASELVHSPEQIEDFVLRLSDSLMYNQGIERRAERRRRVAIPALAVPLNNELQPAGESFVAVMRDISSCGITLYHVTPLDCSFLGVELTALDGGKMTAAVQVLCCRKVDQLFEITGQFVTEISGVVKP